MIRSLGVICTCEQRDEVHPPQMNLLPLRAIHKYPTCGRLPMHEHANTHTYTHTQTADTDPPWSGGLMSDTMPDQYNIFPHFNQIFLLSKLIVRGNGKS